MAWEGGEYNPVICENRFVNIAQSKARRVNTLSCKHARVLLVRVTTLDQSCVALKRTLSVHSNYRPDLHPSQFGRIFGTLIFFQMASCRSLHIRFGAGSFCGFGPFPSIKGPWRTSLLVAYSCRPLVSPLRDLVSTSTGR